MRRTIGSLLGALTLFASAAYAGDMSAKASTRNEALDAKAEKKIEPLRKQFEAGWNKHDAKALSAVFTDDAVVINPMGRVARGSSEIQKLFQDEHGGMMKGTNLTAKITDVREIAPGVLFVDQRMSISGINDPSGRMPANQEVHASMVISQKGGAWKVHEARAFAVQPEPEQGVGGAGMTPESTGEPMPAPAPEDQPMEEDKPTSPTY